MSDNWQHRAKGMRCETCMWFVPKAESLGGWPAVYETDWCGDHKLDETKIKPSIEDHLKEAFKMNSLPTPVPSPFHKTIIKAKESEA